MGDLTRPFNEEEKALMQGMVNKGYELFTKRCADGRKMNIEDIKKIAEGRVWTGEMAKDLKLIDELGGLDEAVEVAASHAKIERYTLVSYPEKEDFLTSLLNTRPSRYISSRMQENFGEYYNGLRFVKNLKDADRLQARMPFDVVIK